MLVEFSVKNFRSIKERVTLSMEATRLKDKEENVIPMGGKWPDLLKGAVIYGANASGKSNLIKAMAFIINLVHFQDIYKPDLTPFLFNTETINAPSEFEIVFFVDKIKYRYGFEIFNKQILREWLYSYPQKKQRVLYERSKQIFHVNSNNFKEGDKNIQDKTREDKLFLNVCAEFNGKISRQIKKWVSSSLILGGLDDLQLRKISLVDIDDSSKMEILSLLKIADLQIEDLHLENKASFNELGQLSSEAGLKILEELEDGFFSVHKSYDSNFIHVDSVRLPFKYESDGTQKLFALSRVILTMLRNGGVLIIDEFEGRLHPLIAKALVKLIHASNSAKPAQLIVATHDTNLLTDNLYRRDQVWFTERDKEGSTQLYSLAEFTPRKSDNIERDYLEGRFGAIPFVGDIDSLLEKTPAK